MTQDEGGAGHTPGPWEVSWESPRWIIQAECTVGKKAVAFLVGDNAEAAANARLITTSPDLLPELRAAAGYLLNAKIDLETGATKATAIRTIEGGLKRVEAAIARAEPRSKENTHVG